ncbi:hypothetical protein NDU88_004591 [Pleurodeles waltl]|uniref:Uncharacterized protein n=1 Tax=Pleurodeles waltl TaxID=8319 RepID=A0AAV7MTZ1_PLEWA|nr:hypothetical protein NDU88_004591 [Pleurodeles waltl]
MCAYTVLSLDRLGKVARERRVFNQSVRWRQIPPRPAVTTSDGQGGRKRSLRVGADSAGLASRNFRGSSGWSLMLKPGASGSDA